MKENDVSRLKFEYLFDKTKQSDDKLYMPHGHVQTNNLALLESNKYVVKKCEPKIIYLGLAMEKNNRDRIIKIAKEKRIEIFQMSLADSEFKLISIKI